METAGELLEDETEREALKDKGIGTPSTRAAIIEKLLESSYIERDGPHLKATSRGTALIALLGDVRGATSSDDVRNLISALS